MMLPDGIDPELWAAFVEMRKQMGKRAPFTQYAQHLVLKKLENFRDWGYDPNDSLRESIERGWRGVFPQGEPVQKDKWGKYKVSVDGVKVYERPQ